MDHEQDTGENTVLDHSDFGNLVPHYSNRFHMFVDPAMSRIYFGDQMLNDGEVLFHTLVTMKTSDLVELRELIDRLLPEDRGASQDRQQES